MDYPHCTDSESSVIGSLLIDPSRIQETLSVLDVEDFYSKNNQEIYKSIKNLIEKKSQVDMVTLPDELKKVTINSQSVIGLLAEYMTNVPSSVNLKNYIEIVLEKSKQRKAIKISQEIINNKSFSSEDISEKFSEFLDISQKNEVKSISCKDSASSTLQSISDRMDGTVPRIPTADVIDERLFGLAKTNLMVIGARPKTGKTALAMNMAVDSAKRGTKVLFISLEMSVEENLERIYARESKVPNFKIQLGKGLSEDEYIRLTEKADDISKLPLNIVFYPGMTTGQLQSIIKEEKRNNGVDLVIIDYLQLLTVENAKSRYEAISQVSQNVKRIAGEEDIAIVAMAQFSRPQKGGEYQKPTMGSFRDSGSIEQDANILGALWLDEEQNEENGFIKSKDINFSLLASRNSPTFEMPLVFEGNYMNFKKLI